MGKKIPESERKLRNIKREKYKTFDDCKSCISRVEGCIKGVRYVNRFAPGKAYKCVPCFK